MKKKKAYLRKVAHAILAVTLVAALVVPGIFGNLAFAEMTETISIQEMPKENSTNDLEGFEKTDKNDYTVEETPDSVETNADEFSTASFGMTEVFPESEKLEERSEKIGEGTEIESSSVETVSSGEEQGKVSELEPSKEDSTPEYFPQEDDSSEKSPQDDSSVDSPQEDVFEESSQEDSSVDSPQEDVSLENPQEDSSEDSPQEDGSEDFPKEDGSTDFPQDDDVPVDSPEDAHLPVENVEIHDEEAEPFAEKEGKAAGALAITAPVDGGICRIRLVALSKGVISVAYDGSLSGQAVSENALQRFYAKKSGKNWKFVNTLNGKVLAVTLPDEHGARAVQLLETTGDTRELWRLTKTDQGYVLKSVADGRILTMGLAANGRPVVLAKNKNNARQYWTLENCCENMANANITIEKSAARGHLPIIEVKLGKVLLQSGKDYTVRVETEGTAIVEGCGNFAGTATATYTVVDAATYVENGWYRLVPKNSPNLVIGAHDGGMINGTELIPAQYMRLEHQIFHIRKCENGKVILVNGGSEKVAAFDGTQKGAALRLYTQGKAGSEYQMTARANGTYVFKNASGRYLKVLDGKAVAGNKKVSTGAEFYLVNATNVPDIAFSKTFYLRTLSRIRLVAGISKSSTANGAKALLTNYADAVAQRFTFLYSSDGYYRIVNEKSRKVLTAMSDGSVQQGTWQAANTQRWRPVASQGGYYLINADGLVLTVVGDYVKKGRQLGTAAKSENQNQIFLLLERGSAEAKLKLVKKPLTIYNGVDYAAVYNYDDYMDRYTNLATIFGTDCEGALRYFVEQGMADGQHGSNEFDVWCYRRVNHSVRKQLLADIPAYYLHYIKEGKALGLRATGNYQTTQATTYNDLAWKAYNEWGEFSNRPYGQQMSEILSRCAQVEYEAYGFPKSIVIAMAIKECGFLTFNGGLPPVSNNVLTMNVSMWNGLWKSSWLGSYVSVKVPQYDSALGQIVYGYEPVRCYEDIEACMDDFANFKTSMLGPIPSGMTIDQIIDTYLEGYATSPGYKNSIKAIIKLHQLRRFD